MPKLNISVYCYILLFFHDGRMSQSVKELVYNLASTDICNHLAAPKQTHEPSWVSGRRFGVQRGQKPLQLWNAIISVSRAIREAHGLLEPTLYEKRQLGHFAVTTRARIMYRRVMILPSCMQS